MNPDVRRRFETIVAEVYEPLQRYLRRRTSPADADEVLGDVLLTMWRRLPDVPEQAPLPWCYGVARRSLANKRRSTRRHLRLVERLGSHPSSPPSIDPAEGDDHPELAAALAGLDEPDREILALWAWEQLEPREIGLVLDITPNAASLRLSRAKKRLSARYARQVGPGAGHRGLETPEERRA